MSVLTSFTGAISAVNTMLSTISIHGDYSVLTGAACGAAIFILNIQQANNFRRLCYFFISFLLGVSCAESTTSLLNRSIEKFITPAPDINKTFTAALTAAVAVRLINKVSDLFLKKISDKK